MSHSQLGTLLQHTKKAGILLRSKVPDMRLNNGYRFVGVTGHGL